MTQRSHLILIVIIVFSFSPTILAYSSGYIEPSFDSTGEMNIDWVYTPTYQGQYAIRLEYPISSEARTAIIAPYGEKFSTLDSFSVYVKYETAVPRFGIYLDEDNDGLVDSVLVSDYLDSGDGSWVKGTGGLRWGWAISPYPGFQYDGDSWNDLSVWREQNPDAIVTHVGLIRYPGGTVEEMLEVVYVDGIEINGVLYDFELDAAQWPSFKNGHSSSAVAGVSADGPYELLWKTNMGSNPSSIVHELGNLYLGTGNSVKSYDETGNLRWSTYFGEKVNTPALDHRAIYVSTWSRNVYALNKDTGDIIWEYESGNPLLEDAHHGFFIYSSPRLYGDVLFVGLADGYIHAIDVLDGSFVWSYETGAERHSSAAISSEYVIIGSNGRSSSGKYLFALDIETGDEVWKTALGGNVVSTPAIYSDICYVGSGKYAYALNIHTGSEIWSTQLGTRDSTESSPAVSEGYVIISGGNWDTDPPEGKVYCLSRGDGDVLWSAGDYFTRASPSISGSTVVLGEYKPRMNDAKIYAYDISTGDEIWSYNANAEVIYGNPSFGVNRVYLASHDNYLYAFKPTILVLEEVAVSSERVNVGDKITVDLFFQWSNGDIAYSIPVLVDSEWYLTDETGTISIGLMRNELGSEQLSINDIDTSSETDVSLSIPKLLWDKVVIQIENNHRTDLGEGGFRATPYYYSDDEPFLGALLFNDSIRKSEVGIVGYRVTGIEDSVNDVSDFEANDFSLIFDQVLIELSCEDTRLDVENTPEMYIQSYYAFDMSPFDGSIELSEIVHQVGEQEVTILSINDPLHGLTGFDSNTCSWIFDSLEITSIGADSNPAIINEEVLVWVEIVYSFDQKVFTEAEGSVKISGINANWNSASNRWELSVTESSAGLVEYSVSEIEDASYGLTTIENLDESASIDWMSRGIPGFPSLSVLIAIVLWMLYLTKKN